MRIIFAGTPEFAKSHLETLIQSKHEVVAVLTKPDSKSGRGKMLQMSAVKQLALTNSIPVEQPERFNADIIKQLQIYQADILIVVAYALILPKTMLEAFRFGAINVHASLLPKWRGAAPIQRAIEAGDEMTGVCIMQMDAGLDTGDVIRQQAIRIADMNAANLSNELMKLGQVNLLASLDDIGNNTATKRQQDNIGASYAKKIRKQEALIDWNLSGKTIVNKIRAFNPTPGAFFFFNSIRIKILQASFIRKDELDDAKLCQIQKPVLGEVIAFDKSGIYLAVSDGLVLLQEVQPANKKIMSAYNFGLGQNLKQEN